MQTADFTNNLISELLNPSKTQVYPSSPTNCAIEDAVDNCTLLCNVSRQSWTYVLLTQASAPFEADGMNLLAIEHYFNLKVPRCRYIKSNLQSSQPRHHAEFRDSSHHQTALLTSFEVQ